VNEIGQVVGAYVMPSESEENMRQMALGLMKRQPGPPVRMFVDNGCCQRCYVVPPGAELSEQALAAVRLAKAGYHGRVWKEWIKAGMGLQLDVIHWMRRFEQGLTNPTNHVLNLRFWAALSTAICKTDREDADRLRQVRRNARDH
jgi:hypothetical protein